ncbi:MAG: arginine--tRNA ligase, partial [Gorillibacterium sp.]|nr:arginine--tRNA ligase [Gorillibacterium sp.]
MNRYKMLVGSLIASKLNNLDAHAIVELLEYPPNPEMGDLSLPCFTLSKIMRKAPQAIADGLQAELEHEAIESIDSVAGYLNFHLNKELLAAGIIQDVLSTGEAYGSHDIGQGKNIVIDYSSPNIAKPFHIGHLRSTVIGNSLKQIFNFLGYNVVGVNHLGDWGTQFGKLIVAYQKWGNAARVEEARIDELLRLYVKFHEEAEQD